MAVRRAPATRCPISSPLSPSLTSLFSTLFLPSAVLSPQPLPFFLFLPLLRHALVVRTLSTKPRSPRQAPFSFPSCHQDRIFLFQSWLPSRIFPHFSAIMSATSACRSYYMLSLPPMSRGCKFPCLLLNLPPRSVVHVHVCRFIRQTRRKAGSGYYIKFDAAKSSLSLCISDFNGNFENCSSG